MVYITLNTSDATCWTPDSINCQ